MVCGLKAEGFKAAVDRAGSGWGLRRVRRVEEGSQVPDHLASSGHNNF